KGGIKQRGLARTDRSAKAERHVGKAVLCATRAHRAVLLLLAEATADTGVDAVCVGGSKAPTGPAADSALELVLRTGERLRIGAGVDAGKLQRVLGALRG